MATTDFPVGIDQRYFEDYAAGLTVEYGAATLEADEIVAFGRRYDPQPFHVDPERAAQGPVGGLIASGWQTAAVMMRLLVEHFLSSVASLGSPGVDELRWLAPVRPGDTLSIRVTVIEARRSRSKPDRGLIRTLIEVLNQRREVVMTMKGMTMMLCRDANAGAMRESA